MNGAKSLALTCSHDAPARSELAWALVDAADETIMETGN